MNNFQEDLNRSTIESHKDYWLETIYPRYFSNIISSSMHDSDMEYQKHGIDRVLYLEGGKKILIDEKIRYNAYNDILLEESSSIERHVAGWIEKPLWTDYIVYNVLPTKDCFLLPFQSIQLAWKNNKDQWKMEYKRIEALNRNYTTLSWAIPTSILYLEMCKSQMINYEK